MRGFIFTCSNRTQSECFERKLFGMREKYKDRVLQVRKGDLLFLLNVSRNELRGVYQAVCDGAKDIEPEVWNGKFPWQVRFKILNEYKPLLYAKKKL